MSDAVRGGRVAGMTAVVTGAARGLGRATAKRLALEGARVSIWDVDATGAAEALEELLALGANAHWLQVDVGSSASVADAARATTEAMGPVDILVNNAGIAHGAKPWEVTDESWSHVLNINATGAFYCIRAVLPDMIERRYGKIVNIASLAAQQGRPHATPAYAASKGALLGLTVSLARSLGEYGICVNAINPGFIRTEIHDVYSEAQILEFGRDIPLARRGVLGSGGLPEDIGAAVLFLASSDSDFITGAFLPVNGGSRTG